MLALCAFLWQSFLGLDFFCSIVSAFLLVILSWPQFILFYSKWVHFCWSSFLGLDFFCSIGCECISVGHPFLALLSYVLQQVNVFLLVTLPQL